MGGSSGPVGPSWRPYPAATFCSHLAMRGAPARAIQELVGHQDLTTTQRYMHLSLAAKDSAIRLLDQPAPSPIGGEDTSRTQTGELTC